jgi:hypothetical protein
VVLRDPNTDKLFKGLEKTETKNLPEFLLDVLRDDELPVNSFEPYQQSYRVSQKTLPSQQNQISYF